MTRVIVTVYWIILVFYSQSSFADAYVKSEVTANVVPVTSLTQYPDGSIVVISDVPPVQCDVDSLGNTICYY